jgi:predicted RNA-binding protein with TRAM domain
MEKFVREGEERRVTITSVQMHHDGDYIVLYVYTDMLYIQVYI